MNPDSSSLSFQHVAPELRLFCGGDSLEALARELKRSGCQRAVVVCGRSVGASSAMEQLRAALGPLLAAECTAVRENSPVPAVETVADMLRESTADAVIAVGGGSAAVTGRAASILLAEKRPARELCTRRLPNGEFESPRLSQAKLPQFIIPSTPSTAFVKAGSAIHDAATGERLALFDPKTRAKALFLHPAFLCSAPPKLVQSATLNTLSTAVEALESPRCDPLSEAMLLQSLRLVAEHLDRTTVEDVTAREYLAIAGVLCGRGNEQSGGGLASVLAHAIGHRSSVANGIVNAILLPWTMRFNESVTQHRAVRIAEGLRTTQATYADGGVEQAIAALQSLLDKLESRAAFAISRWPRLTSNTWRTRGCLTGSSAAALDVSRARTSCWQFSSRPGRRRDPMPSHTRQLAEFVANLELSQVPADVVARAKSIILDGLGCGLFGADLEWTRILAGVVGSPRAGRRAGVHLGRRSIGLCRQRRPGERHHDPGLRARRRQPGFDSQLRRCTACCDRGRRACWAQTRSTARRC